MSDRFELVAIGGGPAALSAIRGYRAAGGTGKVALISDEHRMPYRRPPLTKELLRGEADESELPLEEERWVAEADVAFVSGRAVGLDADGRTVTLTGGRELGWRHCVLATGAEPTRLPIPGADDPAVRVVRTLDHVRDLLRRLPGEHGRVAVIGSGFIGCEIASSLRARSQHVTLISDERSPNERRLGDEVGVIIGEWLADDGVELVLGAGVDEIARAETGSMTVRAGDGSIRAEVVVMATGVAPRTELAIGAGVSLADGAIAVDSSMRTTRTGVLAAGDVCRAENATAGRPLRVEHWGDALAQGEIAGRVAAGEDASWTDVPGFWSTIGQRTLKYAAWGDGYSESCLKREGDGFVATYGRDGKVVGVLTFEADEEYERGTGLIAEGAPWDG
jgi:NADPH-dependent 2,4-dienoyl-CoA reductase/sulfur reductase-like enzyme